jgi:hypothetical protein
MFWGGCKLFHVEQFGLAMENKYFRILQIIWPVYDFRFFSKTCETFTGWYPLFA